MDEQEKRLPTAGDRCGCATRTPATCRKSMATPEKLVPLMGLGYVQVKEVNE